MAKKELLAGDARRLYVFQGMTVLEIADRLGVAEKTIRLWKAEGKWDAEREQQAEQHACFLTEFSAWGYEFMRQLRDDQRAGIEISPSRQNTACRIAAILTDREDYASAKNVLPQPAQSKPQITREELVEIIHRELMGE